MQIQHSEDDAPKDYDVRRLQLLCWFSNRLFQYFWSIPNFLYNSEHYCHNEFTLFAGETFPVLFSNQYYTIYTYIYMYIYIIVGRSGIESRLGRNFPSVQTGPGAHPASCKMDTGSFPGVKCGRGVLLTTHPLLVPRSWKSRAIPLPNFWATPGL